VERNLAGAFGLLAATVFVGCTEAPTIDPGADMAAGGAAGAPVAEAPFVPFSPLSTPAAVGAGGSPSAAGSAGRGGMAGTASAGTSGGAGAPAPVGTAGTAGQAAGGPGGMGMPAPLPRPIPIDVWPTAINADGSVIAGIGVNDGRAVRFTLTTGPMSLPFARPDHDSSAANAISADGLFIVGRSAASSSGRSEAVRWGIMTAEALGFARDTHNSSAAIAVNSDGSIIAGTSSAEGQPVVRREAFRWLKGAGMVGLGALPGDTDSEALAMSADGAAIIGRSYVASAQGQRAFWWTTSFGMVEIGGTGLIVPRALSADGSVVVGDALMPPASSNVGDTPTSHAFRWTRSGGFQLLPPLAPPDAQSRAVGIGGQGAVITLFNVVGGNEVEARPWRWTTSMEEPFKLPPNFGSVAGVVMNATGSTIAGVGTGPGLAPALLIWPPSGIVAIDPLPDAGAFPFALSADGAVLVGKSVGAMARPQGWILRLR
jgi:probable HAF family extracellular repeat protein